MIFVAPSIVVAILELEALSLVCVENLCRLRLRFPRESLLRLFIYVVKRVNMFDSQ